MSTDASSALTSPSLAPSPPALSRPDHAARWLALLLAAGCGALGLALVLNYPLLRPLATGLYLVAMVASFRWWQAAPLLLIGLVPVLGLATWTGWFIFEELDLLVLAAAAGGYAAYAFGRAGDKQAAWRRPLAPSALAKLLLVVYGLWLLWSVKRGLGDAGGFEFGWWQGYLESLNAPRQAKGFVYALLLFPLWQRASASRPDRVERGMLFAMCLALAGISLAALWERVAFPGLLNFSSDYRSTAMFWEMQVGGAQLDGALLLCLPFAVAALLRQRSPVLLGLLVALLLLGVYAALTTFSRGVYLALPVALAVLLILGYRQHRARNALLAEQPHHLEMALRALPWLLLILLFGFSASQVFAVAGYRGLLALSGTGLLLLFAPRELSAGRLGQRLLVLVMAALLGLLAAGLSWVVASWIPKSAYGLYALALALGAWLISRRPQAGDPMLRALIVSTVWFWGLGCVAVVAGNWGGEAALKATLGPALLWALAWVWLMGFTPPAAQRMLTLHWRARSILAGVLLAVGALVSTLEGGAYLSERMTTGVQDFGARVDHWRSSYWLLQGDAERWLGKGSGRYMAARFYGAPVPERVGDYRLSDDGGKPLLRLSGGRHGLDSGRLLRVSQRLAAPSGALVLQARVRANADAGLRAELGEKHLLYHGAVSEGEVEIKGRPGEWQSLQIKLKPLPPGVGGDWWAPRLVTLSIAETHSGRELDVTDLQLLDAGGRPLLANGDFSKGLAYWYFTSDRHHLPWHAKSLPLHIQFEQGWVGLWLWTALVVAALWRVSLGRARAHPLAPAVAASIVGFLTVGLFDSLIDAPRLGFLFYSVLLLGLTLRALSPGVAADSRQ
ncbi:hypothetical protein [Pelomonas sp. SE-A7]|uniref:hypothetical protein n=1 Tax=Pelomonas sp. SE-A7 TaxID=3054953 RepID=UPI00259CEFC5|nr:hypothetical protein [Pelomonas sp. SE-A7]MDM4768098.1 hypothetical protein [Pelomonas sp. SE-A7]